MLAVRTQILLAVFATAAAAQVAEPAPAAVAEPAPAPIDRRIFGVLPNYRTADGSLPFEPITAQQKFQIALKDSTDWPVYLTSGAFAALYQIEDQNHSFGQGMKGYARRYLGSYGDQAIGNMMTEAIAPTLLHEDPRYFRRGTGSGLSRLGYAASRVLITRTDSGGQRINLSELLGNSAAVAISNAYYPETRTASDNIQKLGIQVATDAFSNVLKEFWPDIKRKVFTRRRPG